MRWAGSRAPTIRHPLRLVCRWWLTVSSTSVEMVWRARSHSRSMHPPAISSGYPKPGTFRPPLRRWLPGCSLSAATPATSWDSMPPTAPSSGVCRPSPSDVVVVMHPLRTWLQPIHLAGHAATTPKTHIRCTVGYDSDDEDARIRSEPSWRYREIDAPHLAIFTHPAEIAHFSSRWLLRSGRSGNALLNQGAGYLGNLKIRDGFDVEYWTLWSDQSVPEAEHGGSMSTTLWNGDSELPRVLARNTRDNDRHAERSEESLPWSLGAMVSNAGSSFCTRPSRPC